METLECKSLFTDRKVTPFKGKTREYCIETYMTPNGHTFKDMPEYADLVAAITEGYLRVYPNRDRAISIERMKKSLSYPRTILKLATYQGIPIGFGIFPRLIISGEPVVYSTRAFEKDHEREGLETHVLSESIRLHQKESAKGHRIVRWFVLMTQNAYSVRSTEEIPYVEKIYPFQESYDRNPKARFVMLWTHNVVMLNSEDINTRTGVSRGELSEIGMNEAYITPRREQQRAWEIHQQMVLPSPRGFYMNREAGDVVYVTAELKKPSALGSTWLTEAA